jgi:hypothetical protein
MRLRWEPLGAAPLEAVVAVAATPSCFNDAEFLSCSTFTSSFSVSRSLSFGFGHGLVSICLSCELLDEVLNWREDVVAAIVEMAAVVVTAQVVVCGASDRRLLSVHKRVAALLLLLFRERVWMTNGTLDGTGT